MRPGLYKRLCPLVGRSVGSHKGSEVGNAKVSPVFASFPHFFSSGGDGGWERWRVWNISLSFYPIILSVLSYYLDILIS